MLNGVQERVEESKEVKLISSAYVPFIQMAFAMEFLNC